jgi:hypothetical protein
MKEGVIGIPMIIRISLEGSDAENTGILSALVVTLEHGRRDLQRSHCDPYKDSSHRIVQRRLLQAGSHYYEKERPKNGYTEREGNQRKGRG